MGAGDEVGLADDDASELELELSALGAVALAVVADEPGSAALSGSSAQAVSPPASAVASTHVETVLLTPDRMDRVYAEGAALVRRDAPGPPIPVACGLVTTAPTRVYAARLVGLPIFDPQGDQVGKVRDLVVALRSEGSQPRVLGMVAEVFGRRRIFVPMTRVTNIDSGQVYTTGLLNMRRFEQRSTETLVIGQMLDRRVTIPSTRRHRHRVRRRHGAGAHA